MTEPKLKAQVHLYRETPEGRRWCLFHRCAAKGDYWQPITGNVDPGESPDACALRESWEEAVARAEPAALSPCLWIHDWSRDGRRFAEHVYALRLDDAQAAEIKISGEHRAFEWVDYAEALRRLHFEGNRRGLALAEAWLEK